MGSKPAVPPMTTPGRGVETERAATTPRRTSLSARTGSGRPCPRARARAGRTPRGGGRWRPPGRRRRRRRCRPGGRAPSPRRRRRGRRRAPRWAAPRRPCGRRCRSRRPSPPPPGAGSRARRRAARGCAPAQSGRPGCRSPPAAARRPSTHTAVNPAGVGTRVTPPRVSGSAVESVTGCPKLPSGATLETRSCGRPGMTGVEGSGDVPSRRAKKAPATVVTIAWRSDHWRGA